MKVKFYVPISRVVKVLENIEKENYDELQKDDFYIEAPFLVSCIEVYLDGRLARDIIINLDLFNNIEENYTFTGELPF